ncbi:MAG: hypothetical protein SFW36_18005 [Leptolyngbyaceae cyanobacterium bins.59]|nr:hypothetical protein [Leptolyngbyaceae cyanobacterium bins.59]
MKATRSTVKIGSIEVDGFMLSDGSYRMSQAQSAQAIGEPPVYALRFLESKDSKSLLGKSYTDYKPESVEVESQPGKRGQTRINALPLEVVTAYWLYKASKGNKTALLLTWALLTESLERRFDLAFAVTRTEEERDERLVQKIQQLEATLKRLGEAYAEDDLVLQERNYFENLLKEHGIDPWVLPGNEESSSSPSS